MSKSYVVMFDTSNEVVTVALARIVLHDGCCALELCDSDTCAAHRASNTLLLPMLDALLKKHHVDHSDLQCVCCGLGPGSFTGVRIALATAKGIAQSLSIGLIGISTLDALAWGAWHAGTRGALAVVCDAMRKEVYPACYTLTEQGVQRHTSVCVMKVAQAYTFLHDTRASLSHSAGGSCSTDVSCSNTSASQSEATASLSHNALTWAITGDALTKYVDEFSSFGSMLPEKLWNTSGWGLLLCLQQEIDSARVDIFDAARHNPAYVLPVYTRLSDAEENERARLSSTDAPHNATSVSVPAFVSARTPDGVSAGTSTYDCTLPASGVSSTVASRDIVLPDENGDGENVVVFLPLDAASMNAVAALDANVMPTTPWTSEQFLSDLRTSGHVWWAAYALNTHRNKRTLLAYAGCLVAGDVMELLRIGVSCAHRRCGIARELLTRLADDARNLGATTMMLEVSAANESACAFYERIGFTEVSRRHAYYSNGDDARIMQAPLLVSGFQTGGMEVCEHEETEVVLHSVSAPTACIATRNASLPSASAISDNTPSTSHTDTAYNTEGAVHPLIFAVESSCDETAAALIDGAGNLLADVVASQIDFHARFGGVVPEIASRKHIEAICGVASECMDVARKHITPREASMFSWKSLDAISVTYAPGLLGALVVGVAWAKGVAWALEIPVIGVNHLEGHLYANKIGNDWLKPPLVASLVSGGNTLLVHVQAWGSYHTLGSTIDDAVGEAFDKVAKALGLGYPGGPHISRLAKQGNPRAIAFPRAMLHSGDYRFSLSGLKTAVITYINNAKQRHEELPVADIAASFQQAVIDVQVEKSRTALRETGAKVFCLGGGVAANPQLRRAYEEMCAEEGVRLALPPLRSCGDNAGMIALVAYDRYKQGKFFNIGFDPQARCNLDEPY